MLELFFFLQKATKNRMSHVTASSILLLMTFWVLFGKGGLNRSKNIFSLKKQFALVPFWPPGYQPTTSRPVIFSFKKNRPFFVCFGVGLVVCCAFRYRGHWWSWWAVQGMRKGGRGGGGVKATCLLPFFVIFEIYLRKTPRETAKNAIKDI
jgi:hypothetical protein